MDLTRGSYLTLTAGVPASHETEVRTLMARTRSIHLEDERTSHVDDARDILSRRANDESSVELAHRVPKVGVRGWRRVVDGLEERALIVEHVDPAAAEWASVLLLDAELAGALRRRWHSSPRRSDRFERSPRTAPRLRFHPSSKHPPKTDVST
jgi:hypothetical protein